MKPEIRVLAELGREFERIALAGGPRRRFAVRRWRPLALIAVLVLGGATVGLAATGVILTGAPVPTSTRPVATVGAGLPTPGGSRLLPLRASDPAGGLPWGMRIIRTTRGVICWQIGRVDHGQLGQLGTDGAFGNDGRFHPLLPDALPGTLENPNSYNFEGCDTPNETFAAATIGLEANAASNPPAGVGVTADRREISFGLLGVHALSITYRSTTGTHTRPVLVPLGAYLIVQNYAARDGQLGGSSATEGSDAIPVKYSGPARPNGALTAITYRYAQTTCIANGTDPFLTIQRCGLSHGAPPRPTPPPALHEALRAHLQIHDHVITGAQISFTAPYAVTGANENYSVDVVVGRRLASLTGTSTNIRRGQTVSVPILGLLYHTATRSVTLEVQYGRSLAGQGPQETTIGTTTIHEPPGTRIAGPSAP